MCVQESTGLVLRKVKTKAGLIIRRLASRVLAKVLPRMIRKGIGATKRQFTCLCGGYLGQLANKKFGWQVVPGWKQKDIMDWKKRDLGPLYMSIVKYPRRHAPFLHKLKTVMDRSKVPRQIACKFDMKVIWQYCNKSPQFHHRCSEYGCKDNKYAWLETRKSYSCSCNLKGNKDFAKHRLQCNPNRDSCGGGVMVNKQILFEIDKGEATPHCRRSFAALDALLRLLFTMSTSVNNEKDFRQYCK